LIETVNKKLIEVLTNAGFLPVIASIAADAKGNVMNVNADTLATAAAVAFKADKLIFLTDTAGVLDKNKKSKDNNIDKCRDLLPGFLESVSVLVASLEECV
jgi:acetylglutamate kinase